jgi:replicative DNA helicase
MLATGSHDIVDDNLLTRDYFAGYEDEWDFIEEHYKQYGNVPDKATFLSKFPNVELVEVTESDQYLIDTIREEDLYRRSVPVVKQIAKLLKTDANAAAEYMITAIRDLQPEYKIAGTDIIADAQSRYDQFLDRRNHQDEWYFTTGFPELDDLIHGIQREEEFFVIFARTNQFKSWVLEKICAHIWEIGFNVGYVSPEMSANSIGYRFDTLYKNFSNKELMWGKSNEFDEYRYEQYTKELNGKKFIVSTPNDFNRTITVSKLRKYVQQYKLDILAIDGITYLTDERGKRNDNKTISLTNISEDLMSLSMELHIPILVVVQANRSGVVDKDKDDTPELESIRDSDGIAHNASKVLSLRAKDGVLEIGIKKQRFGKVGGKLKYAIDIDKGQFTFIPSYDDAESSEVTEKKVEDIRRKFNDSKNVF